MALNNFTQGIERFIDSMKGEKYTAIIVANPLSSADAVSQRLIAWRIYIPPFHLWGVSVINTVKIKVFRNKEVSLLV